jgi:hypothetical protein
MTSPDKAQIPFLRATLISQSCSRKCPYVASVQHTAILAPLLRSMLVTEVHSHFRPPSVVGSLTAFDFLPRGLPRLAFTLRARRARREQSGLQEDSLIERSIRSVCCQARSLSVSSTTSISFESCRNQVSHNHRATHVLLTHFRACKSSLENDFQHDRALGVAAGGGPFVRHAAVTRKTEPIIDRHDTWSRSESSRHQTWVQVSAFSMATSCCSMHSLNPPGCDSVTGIRAWVTAVTLRGLTALESSDELTGENGF